MSSPALCGNCGMYASTSRLSQHLTPLPFVDPLLTGHPDYDIQLQTRDARYNKPTYGNDDKTSNCWRYTQRNTIATDQFLAADVIISEDSCIAGRLYTDRDMSIADNACVCGRVEARDVDIADNARITSDLRALGHVSFSGNSRVSGDVCVSKDARVSEHSRVSGRLTVHGNLRVYGNALITGDVDAGGDVMVSNGARVTGRLTTRGRVTVTDDAYVRGHVAESEAVMKKEERKSNNGTSTRHIGRSRCLIQ